LRDEFFLHRQPLPRLHQLHRGSFFAPQIRRPPPSCILNRDDLQAVNGLYRIRHKSRKWTARFWTAKALSLARRRLKPAKTRISISHKRAEKRFAVKGLFGPIQAGFDRFLEFMGF
jgi:hypothetical protein